MFVCVYVWTRMHVSCGDFLFPAMIPVWTNIRNMFGTYEYANEVSINSHTKLLCIHIPTYISTHTYTAVFSYI